MHEDETKKLAEAVAAKKRKQPENQSTFKVQCIKYENCRRVFSSQEEFAAHTKQHIAMAEAHENPNVLIKDGFHYCMYCSDYIKESHYEGHMKDHQNESFICNICHNLYENKECFKKHKCGERPLNDPEKIQCVKCGKLIKGQHGFNKHFRSCKPSAAKPAGA